MLFPRTTFSLMDDISLRTPRDVGTWLAGHGLCASGAVAGVSPMSVRGTAVMATLRDGGTIFLKRCGVGAPGARPRGEAALLTLVQTQPALEPYRRVSPALLHYDGKDGVIATRGIVAHETLRARCGGLPPTNEELIAVIARRLAACHDASRALPSAARSDAVLRGEPPVPNYDHVTPTELAHAAGTDIRTYLAAVQGVAAALRQMREGWRTDCLIHGDLKDDNILVGSATGEADLSIVFVDWELSSWGDPRWDLGTLIGQFLFYWVDSIPLGAGGDFGAWIASAKVPFDQVRHTTEYLVKTYIAASRDPSVRSLDWLAMVVRYAGVFLLHRALVTMEYMGVLTPATYSCLHLGRTLISNTSVQRVLLPSLARVGTC